MFTSLHCCSMVVFKSCHYLKSSVYVLDIGISKALHGQFFSKELTCLFLKMLPFLYKKITSIF